MIYNPRSTLRGLQEIKKKKNLTIPAKRKKKKSSSTKTEDL